MARSDTYAASIEGIILRVNQKPFLLLIRKVTDHTLQGPVLHVSASRSTSVTRNSCGGKISGPSETLRAYHIVSKREPARKSFSDERTGTAAKRSPLWISVRSAWAQVSQTGRRVGRDFQRDPALRCNRKTLRTNPAAAQGGLNVWYWHGLGVSWLPFSIQSPPECCLCGGSPQRTKTSAA